MLKVTKKEARNKGQFGVICSERNEKYTTEKSANATKRELETRNVITFLPNAITLSSSLSSSM